MYKYYLPKHSVGYIDETYLHSFILCYLAYAF